jgi:hypothetical protein
MSRRSRYLDPLVGLIVRPEGRCPRCGGDTAKIAAGIERLLAVMYCTACGAHRGQLSRNALRSIADTIAMHGRRAEPIAIRRDDERAVL